MTSAWPFGPLKPFSYDLAMVDPPWPYELRSEKGEGKSFARHYGAMSWEEIGALPVGHLLAKHAIVFLWCTWPLLFYGGDPKQHFVDADASRTRIGEVVKRWGLRYCSGGAWHKKTKHGKTSFGTGQRVRSSCEPFLLLVNGQPDTSRAERNLIEGLAREHSRKPEEAFAWCERYLPGARRVELFSRQTRTGWDTWGLEAGKYDPVVHENAAPLHKTGTTVRAGRAAAA